MDPIEPRPAPPDISDPLAQAWSLARRDWGQGHSSVVIGERHGLNHRTVRRRAAAEGWPRPPSPEARTRARLESDPALQTYAEERAFQVNELLMRPGRLELARFAFLRATECAALGGPNEAVAWMRLVDQLRRNQQTLELVDPEVDLADVLRARFAMTEEMVRRGEGDELDEDGGEEAD